MQVEYIPYDKIDRQKWDQCIERSLNGLIYATSVYLDELANPWDALILGDYEAVLPMPYRKKFGISYIYPPAFTQQLGIIWQEPLSMKAQSCFINSIPRHFRYAEMNLSAANEVDSSLIFLFRKNYLLNLARTYEEMALEYSRTCNRNISKAKKGKVIVDEKISANEVIDIHRRRFGDKIGATKNEYEKFHSLISKIALRYGVYIIGARLENELIAGSIYFIFKDRITFVLNGNTPESLRNGATHLLLDHTIQHYANEKYTLDFEGSDFDSFARFYEQYGARPEIYPMIKINRLPWPLKYFKK